MNHTNGVFQFAGEQVHSRGVSFGIAAAPPPKMSTRRYINPSFSDARTKVVGAAQEPGYLGFRSRFTPMPRFTRSEIGTSKVSAAHAAAKVDHIVSSHGNSRFAGAWACFVGAELHTRGRRTDEWRRRGGDAMTVAWTKCSAELRRCSRVNHLWM